MKQIAVATRFLLFFLCGVLVVLFARVYLFPAGTLDPLKYDETAVAASKVSSEAATESPLPLSSTVSASVVPSTTILAEGASALARTPSSKVQYKGYLTPEATGVGQPALSEFSRQVANGQADSLCGLYVDGVMALRVVRQPDGEAGYISSIDGTVTQFQKADSFGAIGLLAHNTLAGRDFYRLQLGNDVALVYGDGRIQHFQVSEIRDYQRLTLADLRSDFLELESNLVWTADQVFARFYEQPHRLTLQTCLRRGDVADWGVHFIVADPGEPTP